MKKQNDIGYRTKLARTQCTELSQEQMAEMLMVSRSTYSQYERGRTPIPSRHIEEFCKITGVRADWLVHNLAPMLQKDDWNQRIENLHESLRDAARDQFEYWEQKTQQLNNTNKSDARKK